MEKIFIFCGSAPNWSNPKKCAFFAIRSSGHTLVFAAFILASAFSGPFYWHWIN
jgi:hypothetical protein